MVKRRSTLVLLGDKLPQFMARRGISIEELAGGLGRSLQLVSALMTGFVDVPDRELAQDLCRILNVTEQELRTFQNLRHRDSRWTLDDFCLRMGLGLEIKCELAVGLAKAARGMPAVIREEDWNGVWNRRVNSNLSLPEIPEAEPLETIRVPPKLWIVSGRKTELADPGASQGTLFLDELPCPFCRKPNPLLATDCRWCRMRLSRWNYDQ